MGRALLQETTPARRSSPPDLVWRVAKAKVCLDVADPSHGHRCIINHQEFIVSASPEKETSLIGKDLDSDFFVKLFHEIPEAIVVSDMAGRILKVNREFSLLFGFTEEEAHGCLIDELVAPEETREEAATITEAVAHGQKFTLEVVRRRKDGSLVNVSLLGVPIVNRSKQVAVFGIYRDISARVKAERSLLESRRQLEEANALLELTSNLDGLTAIPNRRNYEHFYELEWRRAAREMKCISLIMIDVDFFKSFNDCYGHPDGDKCLRLIAQALQVINRAGDMVARYGGEEFVAVMSGTPLEGARRMAELMRERVKELRIPHAGSSVAAHVTISLGVASQLPDAKSDPRELLMKADQALYMAKSRGRDRVAVFEA
jgi:diguanylate cyclase (GGDEF)-like protein/PAS domain S-box-containing protein